MPISESGLLALECDHVALVLINDVVESASATTATTITESAATSATTTESATASTITEASTATTTEGWLLVGAEVEAASTSVHFLSVELESLLSLLR